MAYSLAVSYAGQALIDGFNFVSIPDPNGGFVAYQNLPSALTYGYASIDPEKSTVKLSVDSNNSYDSDGSMGGRPSIRIESKQVVNQGSIVIGDFAHMPVQTCGTWQAFWMYGPNWPLGGEIDIIEGVNMADRNLISAHTGAACTLPKTGLYTGTPQFSNCTYNEDIGLVEGCNYAPPTSDNSTYGNNSNAIGGGVYAMEWTDQSIKIWHFPRNMTPQNIVNKQPNPSTWGAPQALFGDPGDPDSCDIGISFYNMSIVLDIDFCGSYAGGIQWDTWCYQHAASSCEIWVGGSPSEFKNSYWEVNYIDVYSWGPVSPTSSTPGLPATSGGPSLPSSATGGSVPTPIATPITTPPGSVAPSGNTLPSNGPSGGISPVSSSPSPSDSLVPERNPAATGSFALLGGAPGLTQTITTTITYTAVCPTNPALLVTQEYCTTLKDCARCAKPSVPMTAITQTCNKCGAGGESAVTLTVPVGVAPGWEKGGNLGWQQPGPKPGDVGPQAPGGGPAQLPAPKPPMPGAPPGAPVAPGGGPGAPGGGPAPGPNGAPAPQPGAKVGNATVPVPTQGVGPTGTGGFKPVQAGAERSGRTSAGVVFGMVVVGLLF